MPTANFRSFIGIAKEATPGTPVAPTDFVAITADPKPKDTITYLDDKSWRGSAVATYGKVPGQRKGEITLEGNLNAATIGYLLQSLLPDLTVTGSSVPYTTTFASKNNATAQPTSYTITDFDGLEPRQYAAAKFNELGIKFTADGLVTFTAKATCWASTIAGSTPTPSFSAALPLASWTGVVSIGGTTVPYVTDGEITIKRGVDVLQTIQGIQDPYSLFSGPLDIDVKLNAIRETSTEFNRYINNTQPPLDIKFTQGANASLQLHMSSCAYTMAEVSRGGNYAKVAITGDPIGNVTDAGASGGFSPIKCTLVGSQPAGTFA